MTILEPNYNWAYKPGHRSKTTHLVLHHAAAGSAGALDVHNWHLSRSWAGIGYHYYVRKDGSVYRGRPESWIGGHTTGFNSVSIGICFEGNFENEQMPKSQRYAGQQLISDILNRYPDLIIAGHGDLNATACPGKNFPLQAMSEPPASPWEGERRYQSAEDMPGWAESTVRKLIKNGSLSGVGSGLDLSFDMLRLLVIGDRNGLFGEDL